MKHEPLRILVDCHVFDGAFQGTTTYLKGLYQELLQDQDKHFFLASANVAHLEQIFGTHANVSYIPLVAHNKFVRLLWEIPQLIRKHKIDYAHFQYVVPPLKACKYILTLHDVLFLDFPQYFPSGYKVKNKFLFGSSARMSNVVLTVSEYSKKQISKHFQVAPITVTPNGVDAVYDAPYDREAAQKKVLQQYGLEPYWLFISRWEPRKNHYNLLRAFVEHKHYEQYQLVCIGSKALPDARYQQYYDALPESVQKKIVALEDVKPNDFLALIRGASLSVYPSVAEGFGIPPLETAAAGVPTICSNTTAMADFTFFGNHFFDPNDPNDLHEKAQRALTDGREGAIKDAIKQAYNWKVAAQAFRQAIAADSLRGLK